MKRKSKELDVDFIGGQKPMSKEEEQLISNFIKARQDLKKKNHPGVKRPTSQRKKVNV